MRRTTNRLLSLSLALLLLLPLLPLGASAATLGDVLEDNFARITTVEGFSAGTADGLTVSADYGDGALVLADGMTDGTWESGELTVPAFEYLVASWSADTPVGTYVEISARAFVDMKGEWSGWLSWGEWSPYIKRASTDQKNSLARIDTDTFTVLGSNGETASIIQLRVALHSDEAGITPVLREVCGTMKNTLDGQAIPVWHGDADIELPESVVISDAPALSQMTRDRDIGDVICSPTTVTMLLNARGEDLLPEEVALREYDFYYEGFGNWPFTVAMAGAYGYTGYCHYADLDFLRQELAAGRTVGISVKYSSVPNGSYPYLENGAANSTGGHLISIVGYGVEDGKAYFLSNDSATSPDAECALRKYDAEQLDAAWSGRMCYVVSAEKETGAGFAAPARVEATLESTGEAGLYAILVDGEPIQGLPSNFSAKTNVLGAGVAVLIPDGAADTSAEGTMSCLATHEMNYLTVSSKGELRAGDSPAGTVYIITNNGPTYVAQFTPVVVEPTPEPAPVEPTPAPVEPAAPAEPAAEPAQGVPVWVWIVAAVAVAAVVVVLVLRNKKKSAAGK